MQSVHHEVTPTSDSEKGVEISKGNGRKRARGRNGPKWSCQSASQNAAGSSGTFL